MKNRMKLVVVVVCVVVIGLTGCGNENEKIPKTSLQTEIIPIEEANRVKDSKSTQIQEEEIENKSSPEVGKSIEGKQLDIELEEELKKYRQEREDNIQKSNGLVEGGSPDEDNYSFDMSGIFYADQFDTREVTEAYAAAQIYVTDKLGIRPSTKMTTYMCIDPRILEIYEDEDKGFAMGYENKNIFVCEYCNEEGRWQYLILVRDGKGSAWNVIHNGSNYKE